MTPAVEDAEGPVTQPVPGSEPDLSVSFRSTNLPLDESLRPPNHADHFTHESLGPWLEGIFEDTYGLDVIPSLNGWQFKVHEGPAHDLEYYYFTVPADELENATYSGDVAGLLLPSRQQATGTVGVSFYRSRVGSTTLLNWAYEFEGVPVESMSSRGTLFGGRFQHLKARACNSALGCHSRVSGSFLHDRNTLAGHVAGPEFIGIFATKRDE